MRAANDLTTLQRQVLEVVADAKSGEISGMSVATWLLRRTHPEGVRNVLRSLLNRGLLTMRTMDDPADEFRRKWPDKLKAMWSITQGGRDALQKRT